MAKKHKIFANDVHLSCIKNYWLGW